MDSSDQPATPSTVSVPVLVVAVCPRDHPFPVTGGSSDVQVCPYCGASTTRVEMWPRETVTHTDQGLATTMQASLLWLEVAIEHQRTAHAARDGHPPAALVASADDAAFKAALVAITAACHAIDGLYGMALTEGERTALNVGARTSRPSRVLEGLKAAFHVGRESQRWASELKWLYTTRDDAVHHGNLPLAPVTGQGASHERGTWSVDAADRAVVLAVDVLTTCAGSPRAERAAAVEWATVASQHLHLVLPPGLWRADG